MHLHNMLRTFLLLTISNFKVRVLLKQQEFLNIFLPEMGISIGRFAITFGFVCRKHSGVLCLRSSPSPPLSALDVSSPTTRFITPITYSLRLHSNQSSRSKTSPCSRAPTRTRSLNVRNDGERLLHVNGYAPPSAGDARRVVCLRSRAPVSKHIIQSF